VAKDSPRITDGELQRLVQKKKKSKIITTYCLGGFQKISSSLVQKQTPAYSVVKQDWIFNWDLVLWLDETKKRAFWQQPHQMCLVLTANIKSASCPRLNIHLDLWNFGPIFLLEVLDVRFRYMSHVF